MAHKDFLAVLALPADVSFVTTFTIEQIVAILMEGGGGRLIVLACLQLYTVTPRLIFLYAIFSFARIPSSQIQD